MWSARSPDFISISYFSLVGNEFFLKVELKTVEGSKVKVKGSKGIKLKIMRHVGETTDGMFNTLRFINTMFSF